MEGAEELAAGKEEVVSDRVAHNFAAENPKLSLAKLGIDVLPGALTASSRVTHINVLDLKHNALQLLPCELFLCLTQLEEIDVSQNRLSYLPETIGLATGLRKLNLRGNAVRALPKGVFLLHALEALDISKNTLAESLAELEHVDISGNPVQRMPLAIERLQTKGELLRSKVRRQKLVRRALHVRGSVRAAFVECLREGS
eukprot:g5336.t2